MKRGESVFPYEGVDCNLLNPKEGFSVAWVVVEILTFGGVNRSVFNGVLSDKFLNPRSVELPIPKHFLFKGDFVLGKICCICHFVYRLLQELINVNTLKKKMKEISTKLSVWK